MHLIVRESRFRESRGDGWEELEREAQIRPAQLLQEHLVKSF